MKEYKKPVTGTEAENSSPTSFFRDIEIEFLIHELKDPISIIETGIQTLLKKQGKYGELSDRQKKTLERTLRNTKKVREMLNGLLEIGRSETGQFTCCRFYPVESVQAVLHDTLETIGYLTDPSDRTWENFPQFLAGHGISLDISAAIRRSEVYQDERKFRQIIGNLLKNALHYRKGHIGITMHQEDTLFWVAVSDDGPGIDPEHHHAIFQRYARLASHQAIPREGHGLGLAGALILARCLGGDIELQSSPGQGATFRLILPIVLQM